MDREDIENIMKESTGLQGFYGRFYYNSYLPADEESKNEFCQAAIDAGVTDLLSFCIWMEE